VTQVEPAQAEVLVHYREIAAEYDRRANKTCKRVYSHLIDRFLRGRSRLLELGGGATEQLASLGIPLAVTCDLSREMLRRRPASDQSHRVVAAGERLPFADARFDAVLSINVLEHVSDLNAVLSESARVLEDEGVWLAITPNGNWKTLLDLAERCSLKIPEGPHRFLSTGMLRARVSRLFRVIEHRTILILPAGPMWLSSLVDRVSRCSVWGGGFFQYIVARKRPNQSGE
jgi:ubiquinone/menaquinone biosynthesis C-methylase UbiE